MKRAMLVVSDGPRAALEPALAREGATWLGGSALSHELRGRSGGFCDRALRPLLHGFPERVRYEDDEWSAYVDANDTFAQLASELVDPDGVVWAHDHHLLLLGAALRRRGHAGPCGLFVHVPFPSADVLDTLPWASALLEGMLAFDLVGFHTTHWARNFVEATRTVLGASEHGGHIGHGGRRTVVANLPLGIDSTPFLHDHARSQCAELEGLRESLRGRKLLLGVDRLDHSKGIPEKLEAFARMLERYPRWRGQVTFVQVSVPSAADELRREVEQLVGRINGRFGEADWMPVRYLYRSYTHDVLAQLYRAADVAVVTPLRDGMNVVAKEFIAAQDPERPGVLVLSRFAGAAEELRWAVRTNPFHRDGFADHLDVALSMALDERRARHAVLRPSVLSSTPTLWVRAFLDTLDACRGDQAPAPRIAPEGRPAAYPFPGGGPVRSSRVV